MLRKIVRMALLVAVLFSMFSVATTKPARAAGEILGIDVYACERYIVVFVSNRNENIPTGTFTASDRSGNLEYYGYYSVWKGETLDYYVDVFAYDAGDNLLVLGSGGSVHVQYLDGASISGGFVVQEGCSDHQLGSVRGTAFEDKNANGKRDPGEPSMWGYYKVTDGGNWFVCGYTGNDNTFGVTVKPGTYYVMPIAPPGYRTTTPRIQAMVRNFGFAALNADMGFVKDANAVLETCDQYNPPRGTEQPKVAEPDRKPAGTGTPRVLKDYVKGATPRE